MRLSITTTLAPGPTPSSGPTARWTTTANSIGESSAGSICWTVTSPASMCVRRSIPIDSERSSSVVTPSSKMNIADRSPRSAAAIT